MESHLEKVDKIPNKSPKIVNGFVEVIIFIVATCSVMASPFLVFLSVTFWLFACGLVWFYPDYGKFLGCYDLWMCENFNDSISRLSIVSTLTVEGDISLTSLQQIFTKNVLNARTTRNTLRYPELKQYITTFLGYRIWKNDPKFNINNHISEKPNNQPENYLVARIHEELHNKPYNKYRSPWEIILIRNVNDRKSILGIRMHHGMADGKSVIKLIVECLGEKTLNAATSQPSIRKGFIEFCLFCILFPIYYLKSFIYNVSLGILSHPWKNHNLNGRLADGCVPWVIGFSPKINLVDIKKVAKQYGVNTSSVLLAMIAGGVRKVGQELRDQDVASDLPMPRSNHPETFANHFYFGSLILPTSESSAVKRLRHCQDSFTRFKSPGVLKSVHSQVMMIGLLLPFLAKYFMYNYYYTMAVSNMAGDEDGFSVGNLSCSDIEMSGGIPGCGGLAVCFHSYKDSVCIAVATKENLMSHEEVDMLATNIGLELKNFL